MSAVLPEFTNPPLEAQEAASIERIQTAATEFPGSLFIMSSAGVDAAVMLNLATQAGIDLKVIHIRTRFQPRQTAPYLEQLEDLFSFRAHIYGPSQWEAMNITMRRLRTRKPAEYSWRTKRGPIVQAIGDLGVQAIISGIRADQTPDRATMPERQLGQNGEQRIYPILGWTQGHIDGYIAKNLLPRHPLYPKYVSVEDKHYMVRGDGRGTMQKTECGIHTSDGLPTRAKKPLRLRWPAIMTSHREQP